MSTIYATPRAGVSSAVADAAILVGRILLIVIFVFSGLGKLTNISGTAAAIASKDLPVPEALAVLACLAELGGGILIAIGWYTRSVALCLFAYTLIAAYFFHDFWNLPPGAEAMDAMIHAFKNLSMAGAFLMLAGTGPGRYSIDGYRV